MDPPDLTPWPTTGHPGMDAQHADLQRLMRCAYADVGNRRAAHASVRAFHAAAIEHFAFEADLMRRTDHPAAADHLDDHRVIAANLLQLVEAVEAGRATRNLLDETMAIWLAHHIGGVDQELAQHVLAVEVAEDFG